MATRRRREAVWIGLLLLASIGGVVFVFLSLSGRGRPFASPSTPSVRAEHPRQEPSTSYAPPVGEPDPPPEEPIASAPEPEPEPPAPPRVVEARDLDETPDEGPALDAEHEAAKLVIELLEADDPDRRIVVTVGDPDGYAIPAALVVVREGRVMLYRERTDVAGHAFFLPYPEEKGPFRVDALAHGYLPGTATDVAPGSRVELTLVPRPSIYGTVRAPVPGGTVTLYAGDTERKTRVRDDGTFLFEDLDEGYVTVQAEVPPYGTASDSFTIEGGRVYQPRLRVGKYEAVGIRGRIGFWPRTGSVTINGLAVEVHPSGLYTFEKAVIGTNEILIDAPGKALFKERFVVEGVTKSVYNFRLERSFSVRGTVRTASGVPVEGADVRLGIDRGDPRNDRSPLFPIARVPVVQTDRAGRFEIDRLDSRLIYTVSVVHQGFAQALVPAVPGGARFEITLPEAPYIYGKLRGFGGVPRDAIVTATRILEEDGAGASLDRFGNQTRYHFNVDEWANARSGRDQKGFYGLSGLVRGLYELSVVAPGFGKLVTYVDTARMPRSRLDLRLRAEDDEVEDETALLRRLPPVIEVATRRPEPGDDTTFLAIDASQPAGEPQFPAVQVFFFAGDEEMGAPLEFTEMVFELTGLPRGRYRAVLTHPLLRKPIVRESVYLKPGEVTELALR